MQTTFATPAVYENGVVVPRFKPKSPPKEVVVVYIGSESLGEEKAPKRRVRKALDERSRLSPSARAIIDARIEAGLRDFEEGRTIGPFSNIDDAIKALES